MNSSTYTYSSTSDLSAGAVAGILIFSVVFAIIIYVVFAFFLSRVFKKAGLEAWKAWVPVYNQWLFLELGGQKGWIVLLAFLGIIPIIGGIGGLVAFVFSCIAAYHIGEKFGKESWWVVLYIFVSPVWLGILAFDSSKWQNDSGVAATAQPPLAAPTTVPAAPVEPIVPVASEPEQPAQPEDTTPTPPQTPVQ